MKTLNYKSRFREAKNSLSNLTDVTIPEKIVEFIKKNPFPKDHDQWHIFAENELKIFPSLLEEYAFAMLTVIFTGGKSEGDTTKIDKEQWKMGEQIEREHVIMPDIDNKVITAIQELFKKKIASDHWSEDESYYSNELFKKELQKERV